jgi:hypothetical protein
MEIVEMIVQGLFIGFGSVGTYLGTKLTQVMIERQIEELKKLIESKINKLVGAMSLIIYKINLKYA